LKCTLILELDNRIDTALRFTAVGVSLIVFFVAWTQLLAFLPDPLLEDEIAKFNFPENDWFTSEEVTIVNESREGYPIPKDELSYNIQITNDRSEPLTVWPKIFVIVGDVPKKSYEDLGVYTYPAKRPFDEFHFTFFANEEGENKVKLIFEILNNTTGEKIDEVEHTRDIQVVSLSNSLTIQSNTTTYYGLIATIFVGFVTAVALFWNVLTNRETTRVLKQANELSVLPALKTTLAPIGPTSTELHISNVGNGPAYNIKLKIWVQESEPAKRDWSKPLLMAKDHEVFFIPKGASGIEVNVDYFKTNQTTIKVKGEYYDLLKKKFTIEDSIDVTDYVKQFEAVAVRYESDPKHKISSSLEKIAKEVTGLNREFRLERLRRDSSSETDGSENQQEGSNENE